jgi:hypothetical protein
MLNYKVTVSELNSEFSVDINYDDYDRAIERYREQCARKAEHVSFIGNLAYEIKLEAFYDGVWIRTQKVLIQGYEYNNSNK